MKHYSILFLSFILLFSCKKADNIGADLLPDDDFLNLSYTDTFTLTTKTVLEEPLRTDKLILNFLGNLNDAYYGKSSAKIVYEFTLPSNLPSDTLGPFIIDSAFLFLKYSSLTGDSSTYQDIVVKTLNADIDPAQYYLSNNTTIYGTTEIGRLDNYLFRPSQRVYTFIGDTIGTAALMKIPIQTSYVQQFIDKIGNIDSTIYKYDNFNTAFRGIEVAIQNSASNAMVGVDLSSNRTKLSIYLRDKNNTTREVALLTRITFGTNATPAANAINIYTNNYTSIINQTTTSTAASDSVNYIIGQIGTTNKITLPSFAELQTVTAVVNKAELLVTQYQQNSDTLIPHPLSLYLYYKNNSGVWNLAGIGSRDSVFNNNNGEKVARYNFNITSLINEILLSRVATSNVYIFNHLIPSTDDLTYNLLYSVAYPPTRLTIGGNNSTINLKTRLKLYYSKP